MGILLSFSTQSQHSPIKCTIFPPVDLRVIVGFDLDHRLDDFSRKLPRAGRVVRGPIVSNFTSKNSGIVTVGRDCEVRGLLVRVLNHAEEAVIHGHAVNGPGRVEHLYKRGLAITVLRQQNGSSNWVTPKVAYMVSTVLAIHLSKHEEFNVCWRPSKVFELGHEVLHVL